MRTEKLGWTDLNLTKVGLGTWAIGGIGGRFSWGPQDDKESTAAILKAIDTGINWIDTAPVYGCGHSEEVVGTALKQLRERPIVATKCGLCWDEDGSVFGQLTKESVRKEAENSLRRLQVDVIDLYQIHWPNPKKNIEEAWTVIADLVKEGKVRYAGVSNFTAPQIKRIQSIHPVASLQPPYSMLRRDVESELLGFCKKNDIGVIAYSPMQKGLLTGKWTEERVNSLSEDDHRRGDPMFQAPKFEKIMKLVDGLSDIAMKHDRTVSQLAIAWVLRRPEITAAIVGARRPGQIEETALAADWELSKEDIDAIEDLFRGYD